LLPAFFPITKILTKKGQIYAVAGPEMMAVDSEVVDNPLNVVGDAGEVAPMQGNVGVYRIQDITPPKIGMDSHRSRELKY
jgi:hypothetical protein